MINLRSLRFKLGYTESILNDNEANIPKIPALITIFFSKFLDEDN